MNRLKDVPELARDGSNLGAVIASVREVLQTFRGYRGDPLDAAITRRTATAAGIFNPDGSLAVGQGGVGPQGPPGSPGDTYTPDTTPPPTPDGLAVSAGIGSIFIECNVPVYTQGHGHDLTVVYGAKWPIGDAEPTFSSAVELMRFQGTFTSYSSDPNTRWCIWIKWMSNDDVLSTSPAGGTNGVQATTGEDVSSLVKAMTGPGNPFTVLSTTTVIDGVTFSAGTYSTKSFVIDGQITNAKIVNLAVDDAKIASMGVAKLTAGNLSVGAYVRSTSYSAGYSGFSINADGSAEFNNVTVRGEVVVGGNPQISGSTMTGYGSHLYSDGRFVLGTAYRNIGFNGTGTFMNGFGRLWNLTGDSYYQYYGGVSGAAMDVAIGSWATRSASVAFTITGWVEIYTDSSAYIKSLEASFVPSISGYGIGSSAGSYGTAILNGSDTYVARIGFSCSFGVTTGIVFGDSVAYQNVYMRVVGACRDFSGGGPVFAINAMRLYYRIGYIDGNLN